LKFSVNPFAGVQLYNALMSLWGKISNKIIFFTKDG